MTRLLLTDNDFGEKTGKYYYSNRILLALSEIDVIELNAIKSRFFSFFQAFIPRIFIYTFSSQLRNYRIIKSADYIIIDHLRNAILALLLGKKFMLIQHNIEFNNLRTLKSGGNRFILYVLESYRLEFFERLIMRKAEVVSFISYGDFETFGGPDDFWLPPYFDEA